MVIQQFFQVKVWFRSRLLKEICGVLDRKARQSGLGGGAVRWEEQTAGKLSHWVSSKISCYSVELGLSPPPPTSISAVAAKPLLAVPVSKSKERI